MNANTTLRDRLGLGRLKWYHMYYAMAAFDIVTIVVTLYLSHAITGIYANSVGSNRQWAQLAGRFAELGQQATVVNAPGNDVFDSVDVTKERSRMTAGLVKYNADVTAIRSEVAAIGDSEHRTRLEAGSRRSTRR